MNGIFKKLLWMGTGMVIIGLLSFGLKSKRNKEAKVEIVTKFGVMTFKLYNETPLHRDNFLKLAKENYFDSLLFHRVINQFMIQGGDPDSKGAKPGQLLGDGGPDYEIPAEFVPELYHKKGVLAAAREGDDVNPEKKSSASQFYIVQGRVYDSAMIKTMEERLLSQYRSVEFKACLNASENRELHRKYMNAMKTGDQLTTSDILNQTKPLVDARMEKYKFTEQQIRDYSTVGGTPHLDHNYTVFGEMISGFDVLDSIAVAQTDNNNRPLSDILMHVRVLK